MQPQQLQAQKNQKNSLLIHTRPRQSTTVQPNNTAHPLMHSIYIDNRRASRGGAQHTRHAASRRALDVGATKGISGEAGLRAGVSR